MLQKLNCYVGGHDYAIRRDADRVYLRCDACGRTSRGWSLAESESDRGAPPLTRLERVILGKRQPAKASLR